jgi:hypothetical protein
MSSIKGALNSTFPFNTVSRLSSYYSTFSVDAAAPSFILPLPLGNSLNVDLSIFDPLAAVIRFLLGLSATIGVTYYIFQFWRGVS